MEKAKITQLLYYFKRQSNFSCRNCRGFLEDIFDKRCHNSGPLPNERAAENPELCSAREFPSVCWRAVAFHKPIQPGPGTAHGAAICAPGPAGHTVCAVGMCLGSTFQPFTPDQPCIASQPNPTQPNPNPNLTQPQSNPTQPNPTQPNPTSTHPTQPQSSHPFLHTTTHHDMVWILAYFSKSCKTPRKMGDDKSKNYPTHALEDFSFSAACNI